MTRQRLRPGERLLPGPLIGPARVDPFEPEVGTTRYVARLGAEALARLAFDRHCHELGNGWADFTARIVGPHPWLTVRHDAGGALETLLDDALDGDGALYRRPHDEHLDYFVQVGDRLHPLDRIELVDELHRTITDRQHRPPVTALPTPVDRATLRRQIRRRRAA